MSLQIKQPESAEEFKSYYHLRWSLLRAPWHQAEGSEIDDMEDQCFHLMAIDNKKVHGVARLQFNNNEEAQIRYMAVAERYQRQGIGRQLIESLEQYAKDNTRKIIVLDAREPAVDFYKKLGYHIVEKSYLLFDEIQHFRMLKKL